MYGMMCSEHFHNYVLKNQASIYHSERCMRLKDGQLWLNRFIRIGSNTVTYLVLRKW